MDYLYLNYLYRYEKDNKSYVTTLLIRTVIQVIITNNNNNNITKIQYILIRVTYGGMGNLKYHNTI
jgi:hypothetical protein